MIDWPSFWAGAGAALGVQAAGIAVVLAMIGRIRIPGK